MTTCAIYVRKSTEQNGTADEEKSVARQVEHARRFAEQQGWAVAEDCVFSDDAVSGSEFDTRVQNGVPGTFDGRSWPPGGALSFTAP